MAPVEFIALAQPVKVDLHRRRVGVGRRPRDGDRIRHCRVPGGLDGQQIVLGRDHDRYNVPVDVQKGILAECVIEFGGLRGSQHWRDHAEVVANAQQEAAMADAP